MQEIGRYHAAVRYLEGLSNIRLKIFLNRAGEVSRDLFRRMAYFLKIIGIGEQGIRFIHITGTAGKGSVTNMLHEIFSRQGKDGVVYFTVHDNTDRTD